MEHDGWQNMLIRDIPIGNDAPTFETLQWLAMSAGGHITPVKSPIGGDIIGLNVYIPSIGYRRTATIDNNESNRWLLAFALVGISAISRIYIKGING